MPITAIRVDTVAPRGGAATTAVVVKGVGFGIVTGTIVFDPLGTPVVTAPATLWQDDEIHFVVPTLFVPHLNRTLTVQAIRADASDFGTFPFWIPSVPSTSNGLDYQWPDFEESTPTQDVDDPRKMQAADFNRLRDLALAGGGGGGSPTGPAGGQLAGTYPNPTIDDLGASPGQVLKWNGLAWAPAVNPLSDLKVDRFTPSNGQTLFALTFAPSNPLALTFEVNGVTYRVGDGNITVLGLTVTWTGSWPILAGYKVVAVYPV